MTSAEYESILLQAAKENDQLRDQIRQLQTEPRDDARSGVSSGDAGDNPVCRGCFHWRMLVAGATGALFGLGLLGAVQDHSAAVEDLATLISGNKANAGLVQAALVLLTVIAPGLAVFVDWNRTLYKHNLPGLFRAIAELWKAFKRGQGKDE